MYEGIVYESSSLNKFCILALNAADMLARKGLYSEVALALQLDKLSNLLGSAKQSF